MKDKYDGRDVMVLEVSTGKAMSLSVKSCSRWSVALFISYGFGAPLEETINIFLSRNAY